MRRLAVLALAGLALAAVAATDGPAARRAGQFAMSNLSSGPITFRDTVLSGSRRIQAARRGGQWGGSVTANDGETAEIYVSNSYPVDPTVTQSLADFIVQLYHGDELSNATFYMAPIEEIQSICGARAGGCYDPESETIVIPGENLPDANNTTKETILAHEYGHHVARNRSNSPWSAEDWGTKRWATAIGVCKRTADATAFPGDERANYLLNPGEAFAETFRVLNFGKQVWPSWTVLAPWNVDQSFYPDAADLKAAQEDVLDPWTGPTVASWSGRIANVRRVVRQTIDTPLDGSMSVKLTRVPRGATISVVDPATGAVLSSGGRRASVTVCGQRSLVLTVKAKATGLFSAIYATP